MKKKIIYIAGYGRSGSSIIALILGQHKNIISLGEIGVIFSALKHKRICTCGQKLDDCEYWGKLIKNNEYRKKTNIILNKLENPYLNVRIVIDYIFKKTNSEFLVDSTKTSWRNLSRPLRLILSGYDVHIIHLKRSQESVIYSAKKGKNSDLESNLSVNNRFSNLRTIVSYQISNTLTVFYKMINPKKYFFINYEDLLDEPIQSFLKLSDFLNIDLSELDGYIKGKWPLKTSHEINGNRLLRQKNDIYFKKLKN